jgi:phenylalanyl-tRNA synthetase beta chain
VAALTGAELRPVPGVDPPRDDHETFSLAVEELDACPRFIARVFRNVSIGESPAWLKARLIGAGMRPISNVVDITNYVMLALGNPLHVFDYETLHGGEIVVRRARKGETLRTLDGNERRLDPADLVIADADRPVALAGIMGGEETEVSERTTSVLLEAANFDPISLLRTSERLALRTEGSNRWEKGVDPYLAGPAATMATRLVVELSGARWTGAADVQANMPEPVVLTLRPERTNALLGLEVTAERQTATLEKLGFDRDGEGFRVPTWRARDVTREIDLVEEVARFVMEEIPFTLPEHSVTFGRLTRWQQARRRVEDVLAGCGFSEAYTSSFVAEGDLRLPEPISQEAAALRTSLGASLVAAARGNLAVGATEVALFEIARTYRKGGELPDERWHVAGVVDGGFAEAKWAVEQLYAALKVEPAYTRASEPLLHPGQAAQTAEGWVGELHPTVLEGTWGAFELDLDALVERAPAAVEFEAVSDYPPVRQDLAFVVDAALPAGDLLASIREAGAPELQTAAVFDEYRGEQVGPGKKSLAFRVSFGSLERTLTDEEAAAVRGRIVQLLADRHGAVLRA